jgi:hypothetical protein
LLVNHSSLFIIVTCFQKLNCNEKMILIAKHPLNVYFADIAVNYGVNYSVVVCSVFAFSISMASP